LDWQQHKRQSKDAAHSPQTGSRCRRAILPIIECAQARTQFETTFEGKYVLGEYILGSVAQQAAVADAAARPEIAGILERAFVRTVIASISAAQLSDRTFGDTKA
jgi:hypothetical protein